jgi:hypothetical protein
VNPAVLLPVVGAFAVGAVTGTVLLALRLSVVERDLAFWKHHAHMWRKTAKTHYAIRTQKNWPQVEREFNTWTPPSTEEDQ